MASIVILDVDEGRQHFYERALVGHVVSFVDRPVEAAYLCRAFPQDLVIAEWFDADGPRVIEEMGRFHDFAPPPVVLTADIRSSEKVEAATIRAIDKGAAWLIPFPMSRAAFRTEVESIIEEYSTPFEGPVVEITAITPPPGNLQMMIEQTVGWGYVERMMAAILAEEGMEAAQHCSARMFEWAASDVPTLYAATWSQRFGDRPRHPSEELLFRIAHGMLFPGIAAA